MEQEKNQARSERMKYLIEIISTVIMSIATLATAWSSYQASRWGGVMTANFNLAGANRTESVRSSISGGQRVFFDVVLFNEWLKAVNQDDQFLADFYYDRMDFQPALDAWLEAKPLTNSNAPKSPFVIDTYMVEEYLKAEEMEAQAAELFQQGLDASQKSDDYILNAVILASVLFFSGISTRFSRKTPQLIMLVAGFLLLINGVYNIIVYPVN